jgi:C-terminal processing protease CtpA/Prc
MIEAPASLFELDQIVEVADFLSVGTNDLSQFMLAADRNEEESSASNQFLHPSVLRALTKVIETSRRKQCPVCVCGEVAGDPLMTCLLARLGLREFSMSPVTLAQADVSEIARKLGLTMQELTEETSRYFGIRSHDGVIVTKVERGSPADRAGIRPGNIIVSVNQRDTDTLRQFNEALKESLRSKKVLLLIKSKTYTRFVVLPLN